MGVAVDNGVFLGAQELHLSVAARQIAYEMRIHSLDSLDQGGVAASRWQPPQT